MKKIKLLFLCYLILFINSTAQIFVATDGNDAYEGTFEKPLATINKAITKISMGDTIYVRGGTFTVTATISIGSSLSGKDTSKYYLFAYKDEKPLLDFTSMPQGPKGISLRANYWYIKGISVKGAGDNGMEINGGSYNTIENCSFFENKDSGMQLGNGASFNRIINCDSYFNADPPDYGDADGFAPKLTVGDGNYFSGCRSWSNCDDGWDGYMRGATNVNTTLENCWTWGNGYLKDGTDPGSQANGNGFKMGGGDNSNNLGLMHHFLLVNCLAFENKAKGFDQNNNVGSMTMYNCSGFNNGTANYRVMKQLSSGQTLTVKNSLSYDGKVELGSFAVQEKNGWLAPFQVTEDDFISLDFSQADAARNEDGSLPKINFLNLSEGSDLIDAGVDLGYSFIGQAPDLGAFESDYTTGLSNESLVTIDYALFQNYPNPFNPVTNINYKIETAGLVNLTVYDILGKTVTVLVNELKSPGTYDVQFDGSHLASGLYIYRITTGKFTSSRIMSLIK